MGIDVLAFDHRHLRGTDSNTLLRMYDLASETVNKSPLQQERVKADKAIQRIAKELKKRKIQLLPGHQAYPRE